jgi:hypothetical protein
MARTEGIELDAKVHSGLCKSFRKRRGRRTRVSGKDDDGKVELTSKQLRM